MAYTEAIFHIDYVNGNDGARTALTSTSFTWNAGTSKMRATKTGHGLVTGAIVDITATTGLNGDWKITVIDTDTFDLDSSTNVANTSGTVTPRGGSSWADAWLTVTTGATAARIQPGDEMRIAKTPDPVGTGVNATFTNESQNITLASAITKTVDHAIGTTDWTAATNISLGTNTSRKIGANALVVIPAGAFTTGKVVHKSLGSTENFSGYTKLSFWFRPTTYTVIAANTYKLCLCSDTGGNTIVNEINIPATLNNNSWHIMVLDNGAALGASIQSVAIYANSDPGTTAFSINNIVACNGADHSTLIGPSGDVYYNVQSFDGTTIKVDSNNSAATGRGWSGTTNTSELFYRTGINFLTTGNMLNVNEGGNAGVKNSAYVGGWNTGTNAVDGETVITNLVVAGGGATNGITYITFRNFVFARTSGIGLAHRNEIHNSVICGGSNIFSALNQGSYLLKNNKILNNSNSLSLTSATFLTLDSVLYANNPGYVSTGFIVNCTFRNNAASLSATVVSDRIVPRFNVRDCLVLDSTEVASISASLPLMVASYNHDQVEGNHWIWTGGCTINWQTTEKQGSDPGSWRFVMTSNERSIFNPVRFKIAEVAVNANDPVTVKCWIKKDHATGVQASLYVDDAIYSLPGITETSALKANDTNWEEVQITFTPTSKGVVPIWVAAWRPATNSNIYVGSITVTQ